jgi:hypothetical protein
MDTQRTAPNAAPREAQIVRWRHDRLIAAGFANDLAADLAQSRETDLHAVLDLIDRGCPPALAARILAPLDDPTQERP